MEVIIGGSLLGLGYLMKDEPNREYDKNIEITSKTNKQYQITPHTSQSYYNVHKNEENKVKLKYEQAKKAIETNIIPPYFNDRIYNDQTTSVQYLQRPVADRTNKKQQDKPVEQFQNLENFYQPLIQSQTLEGSAFFSDLAGKQINETAHNNMVPFFGGSMRQSVDPNANRSILENFQGAQDFRQPKNAIKPMFEQTKDISYVYGTPNTNSMVLDRYIPSMYRTSEVPIEPIRVGPGLNQGYVSNPIGGFQQIDAQEYALPKTVDQLRAVNNPKISYESRATGAPKAIITNRGLTGAVEKKLPDTFYIQTPDMYIKTTGAYVKPEMAPKYEAKDTSRQNSISYEGIAAPSTTHIESLRPAIRESNNLNYETDGMRNAYLNTYGQGTKDNYSVQSYTVKPNERETTEDKTILTNITTAVKSIIAPFLDIFRTTKKENVIGNPNKVGYMAIQAPKKITTYDPNDIAKTTLKETNIHNNRTGQLDSSVRKGPSYDPNDIAKTTLKETNIHNNRTGQLESNIRKGPSYDPNDISRTTIKETNIHNNRTGQLETSIRKGPSYDPNDISRTTIKETNIHNNRTGQLETIIRKGPSYDPNDISKTTIKETNIHNNRTGQLDSSIRKGPSYDPNDISRTTIKETNIHNNRTGQLDSSIRKGPSYDPNDISRTTIKETNIHNNRTGQLDNSIRKGPSYDPNDISRTTIKETNIHNNRTGQLETSVRKGPSYDPNDISRTTIKETNIHNNRTGQLETSVRKGPSYDPNDISRTTIKETNIHNNRTGQLESTIRKGPSYDPNDISRTTIKETNIHNNRTGQLETSIRKGPSYDPNDISRTTIKETNIHNNRTGQLETNIRKGPSYDPNDIGRTTIKETNIHNNRTGQLETSVRKGPSYDPNDITRTTIKETNIHNNRTGQLETSVRKGPIYDPNDITKTTIKETNIHNNRTGSININVKKVQVFDPNDIFRTTVKQTTLDIKHEGIMNIPYKKHTAYDPNDIAKTTIKETNINNERTGNFSNSTMQSGDGYIVAEYDAPNTNRQFTSDYEYEGIADGNVGRGNGDGYIVAEYDAQNTNRQFTSDFEYSGIAKDINDRPMDDNMYNNARLNEIKTDVSQGRYPTLSSTKLAVGGNDVNMEVKKLEDDRLNQYSPAVHRLYTQTPTLNSCNVTTDKDQLPNESLADRINPSMLTAFNQNPYTQPLNSF